MTRVFLSYSRGDAPLARYIHDGLEQVGFTVFWDQENPSGERWAEQIMDWLQDVAIVVLIVSPHSVGSYSVQSEIQIALIDLEKRVMPVQITPKQELLKQPRRGLWFHIRPLQRIDAWPPQDVLDAILTALAREGFGQTAAAPAAAGNRDDTSSSGEPDDDEAPLMLPAPAPKPPPPPSAVQARIVIELPGTPDEFDEREREGFTLLLASLAKISPRLVKIVAVEAGSIRVTVELPESTARWLVAAKDRGDEVAQKLGIQAIRGFVVLPNTGAAAAQSGPLARLREWFAALSAPQRLVGAGALSLLVLALVLFPFLNLTQSSPMIALCADLSLASGSCPRGSETAFFEGAIPDNTLSGVEEAIPRLIAPRGGRLLEPTTRVSWTEATDATSYEVLLSSEGREIWTGTVTGTTTLDYPPPGIPPLDRGATYRFTISTADGRSESAQGIGFTVLPDAETQPIRADEQAIRAEGLDATSTATLVANLYASNQLYGEALGLLEPVAETATQPSVELLRGNIYLTIDLPELALQSYERALTLAQASGDDLTARLIQARIDAVREKLGT